MNPETKIQEIQTRIKEYTLMMNQSVYPQQKMYYERLIRSEKMVLIRHKEKMREAIETSTLSRQREFTLEELAKYNGANGNPAYIAVNGIVYDVSNEATWGGGTHFGLVAGQDLTNQFAGCHANEQDILKRLPVVGTLKSS